jgi:hypothetical protein
MAEQKRLVPLLDDELNAWLNQEDDETREVIVEARVPQRRVQFARGSSNNQLLKEVTTEEGLSRAKVLAQLCDFLTGLLGSAPHILSAGGAIPLRATQDQLRQIVRHHLVKAVRANRKLK